MKPKCPICNKILDYNCQSDEFSCIDHGVIKESEIE